MIQTATGKAFKLAVRGVPKDITVSLSAHWNYTFMTVWVLNL